MTTDIGPAAPAPGWILPGTEPAWDTLTEDGATLCSWTRDIGAHVWISAEDRTQDGRWLRSAPTIGYTEPSRHGLDATGARRLAAELLNAADILDEHTD